MKEVRESPEVRWWEDTIKIRRRDQIKRPRRILGVCDLLPFVVPI